MTDKHDLNNELILMKKTIKQAKICVIGKLVRKLKDISNRQGKELTGLRLIGKKSRLTDQIDYLKKTSNLQLASLALTFDKNPTKIVTNLLASTEDASLANIVTFKTVRIKVDAIKSKFGLDDSKEDWRERLREIGKKKKKKIEKETNKIRNKKRKEAHKKQSELVKKRDDWLIENLDTEETVQSDEETVRSNNFEEDKGEKNCSNSFNSLNSKRKIKDPLNKKLKVEPSKIVDPFFITGTGASYLATSVINRIQPSGPNDGLDRKERRAQQFNSKAKVTSKRTDMAPILAESSNLISKIDIEGLNPSWAAKIKAKGIEKFQSKKMQLSDEQPANVVEKTSYAPSPNDSAKLHPSWAAKQKLKPIISEFKGSKIVFDD